MKKNTLLIIIGGVLLISGILLTYLKKEETVYYYVETEMTKDEATALVSEKVKNLINVFENKDSVFLTEKLEEDESNYIKVTNYDEVVKKIYTENGIEELEKTKFEKKEYVKKEESDVYLLQDIPEDNKFTNSSITISDFEIELDRVKAKVTFSSDKIDQDGILTYYVYDKTIVLIRDESKNWLVDTFVYNNK